MWELIVILLLILFNGVCSMAEIAMISARKSKLQTEADKGNRQARAALKLAEDPDRFLSVVQTGITLIGILTGLFSGARIAQTVASWFISLGIGTALANTIAKAIIVLIVMYFTILLGELLPKRIALGNPEKVAMKVSSSMTAFAWLTRPLVIFLAKSSSFCAKKLGIKDDEAKVTEDEIISLVQEGSEEGEVSAMEHDIVERVFTLGDLSVSSIMTLRDDVVWLDLNMDEKEITEIIEANIYEQYPVCDGDLDNIEGVLTLKDYVLNVRKKVPFNLKKMMKKPEYFHENMSVYSVLENMKKKKINRALVCDEFGALSGIISLKDILDALVGNVGEEHQKEPDIVPRKNMDGWFVDGQCPVYDFLSYFDLVDDTMEDYDFSTMGGMVFEVLENVPTVGEAVDWEGFHFEVADMDGARIDKLIVTKNVVSEPENNDGDENA